MRLYTRTGATVLEDPDFGTFNADEQGGFDFPNELSSRLRAFHVEGRPVWEDDIERQQRLLNEEMERRKDPATLLGAVEALVAAAKKTETPDVPPTPPPGADTSTAGHGNQATSAAQGDGHPDGPGDGDPGTAGGDHGDGAEDDAAKATAKKTAAKKTAAKTAK
ncbi:hypothetical protein ACIQI8_27555 [Streptomyces sp. NPDC092369]|uniref:hypothetical protein n=1 Tax=Streptomyces sp. NPDC092369 TaxID=3366015 RepID=UPI00380BB6A2